MSTKSFLHEVMSLAWQFVRKNGFTMSEALKCAWAGKSSVSCPLKPSDSAPLC